MITKVAMDRLRTSGNTATHISSKTRRLGLLTPIVRRIDRSSSLTRNEVLVLETAAPTVDGDGDSQLDLRLTKEGPLRRQSFRLPL